MHILLTDVLTCPRCGPDFGLIVLAEQMEDRRVLEGSLGCANCREEYRVRGGVAELRPGPPLDLSPTQDGRPVEESALRIAALLGVGERGGTVLLLGSAPEEAREVARLLPGAQVAAAAAPGDAAGAPAEGVSWLAAGERLPFRGRSLRGVSVRGVPGPGVVEEALRALAPGARLVLDPAPEGTAERLRGAGVEVLLEQEGVVVASPTRGG